MKKTKLMWCAYSVIVFVALFLVGCELNEYSIDPPADLQHRIDSIADAKGNTGDTTHITIATAIVGAEDNSTGWNGAHSDYFAIPTNKLLHLEFINHAGAQNWNNWNLAVTNVEANTADYSPDAGKVGYFTLRADKWGWGNSDFNRNLISLKDANGNEDVWNDFLTTMNGAHVSIDIDHSVTGNVFVTAKSVGTNGITLIETYTQPVSATDSIVAFLVVDGSHFDMKKAYLLPSKVTAVEDSKPVSIAITGSPALVKLSTKNFWGSAVATVTYADGSSKKVDSADVSFTVIPDMTTLGHKTVIAAYSKTKQGKYTPAVSTFYNIEVVNNFTQVGASNFSTPWPTYSGAYTVASGTTRTITMYCYSDNVNNWHSPCLAVGKAGNLNVGAPNAADAVVRMDNFGWGPGYGTATLTNDWNWGIFASNISGSKIVITVTNNGNNTANVRYDVTYSSGEKHFQQYAGLTIDSSNLSCRVVLEKSYIILVD